MCKRGEPCPAGIEDACPIPRYRCREVGQPGKHCFELFAEFEAFVLPTADDEDRPGDDRAEAVPSVRAAEALPDDDDTVTRAVLLQTGRGRGGEG